MSDDQVWVRAGGGGRGLSVYHTDRDCPCVKQMASRSRRARSTLPADLTLCEWCADRRSAPATSGKQAATRLRHADPDVIGGDS